MSDQDQLSVANPEEDAALAAKVDELAQLELSVELRKQELAAKKQKEDAETADRKRRHDEIDKQIEEKKKQLAELNSASSTVGNHPDTFVDRGPVQPRVELTPLDPVVIDSRGQIFDQELHGMDGDKPYRDSTGSFVKKENHFTPSAGVAGFGTNAKQ